MDTISLPAVGGCRCDRLRFTITAAPMLTSACHCRGCLFFCLVIFSPYIIARLCIQLVAFQCLILCQTVKRIIVGTAAICFL